MERGRPRTIADKQTLGQIRPALHKEVRNRLVREIGKTLTKASVADIEKALT
jgi:protein required for attachment to host cells